MARTQPQEFDAQSWLFEKDMIAAIVASRRPKNVELRSNVRVHLDNADEEIDLLLLDKHRRRLMICELRWMLGPGDPREVQNRKKECLKKVDQVRRKVEWVSMRAGAVAKIVLGLEDTGDLSKTWVTTGVVLIAGFGGTRSPDPKYPIMPSNLFERGMGAALSLEALALWCQRLSWLPQEGRHFTIVTSELEVADSNPLIIQAMDIPDSAGLFVSDAIATLSDPN